MVTPQVILLRPEDVLDGRPAGLTYPEYARIVDDTAAERVGVLVLDDPAALIDDEEAPDGRRTWLSRTRADRCRVWAGELSNGATGRLLRRPVFAMVDGMPVYGQVTAYDNLQVTIRNTGGTTVVAGTEAEVVAPVVVFLLHNSSLLRRIRTRDTIARAHSTILDRLLGSSGHSPTRNIRQLLNGIAPVASHPRSTDRITWMDPLTGRDVSCSVGHVVEFGFPRDANGQDPDTPLGANYWEDPTTETLSADVMSSGRRPTQQTSAQATTPLSDAVEATPTPQSPAPDPNVSFVDFMDSLEERSPNAGDSPSPAPAGPGSDGVPGAKRSHAAMSSSDSAETFRLLSFLAEQPDMLQHYARQLSALGSQQQRPRYSSVSDLRAVDDANSSNDGRHSFRPSARQQAVHNLICAEEHRGKSPAVFVEYSRASRSTKFIPFPAIICRIYDFLFGVCGLSVLHFRRFDLKAQVDYANSTQLSARNFSVKVELPHVPAEPSYGDLKAALGVLGSYCDEFFDGPTRRLVSAAKDFAEELSDYEPWSTTEVRTLAFWFSNTFAAYRLACEHDIDHQTSTRLHIHTRMSLQDPELSGLLFQMSRQSRHETSSSVSRADPRGQTNLTSQGAGRPGRSTAKAAPKRGVPADVARAAPRQGGKQVCLRFLSNEGCPSTSPDRCTHSFLGHFVPKVKLDPIVKAHVIEQLGGFRSDLQHL